MNDMPTKIVSRQQALFNLRNSIDAELRFPKNVFARNKSVFLFFDADWVFDAGFVAGVGHLLEIEGGICAPILDLDSIPDAKGSSFFIDKEIDGAAYQSFLNGSNDGGSWMNGVGRFGCTSDVGEWSIYCEKRTEIAAIAVRDDHALGKYARAIAQFKMLPIDQAVAKPLSYGFSDRALSAEWRSEFLRNYK